MPSHMHNYDMINNFNSYYRDGILNDENSEFFSWAKRARKISEYSVMLDFGVADAFCEPPTDFLSAIEEQVRQPGAHAYIYEDIAFNRFCLEYSTQHPHLNRASQLHVMDSLVAVPTAGAKGALNVIAQVFVEVGDVVLVTEPGYPIFQIQAERLGAKVIKLPLLSSNGFLPDFSCLSEKTLDQAKLLMINYPNNPTGKVLTQEEIKVLVDFCHQHCIILINDAAYGKIVFDKSSHGSFYYEREVLTNFIEISSLSKSLQIPGWRLGYIVCHRDIAKQIRKVALMQTTGHPKFLLAAISESMPQEQYLQALNRCIQSRLGKLAEILAGCGFKTEVPEGTFFLYVKSPIAVSGGDRFQNPAQESAEIFARKLGVIVTPWEVAGQNYLRFSVAFRDTCDEETFSLFEKRISKIRFVFE